MVKRLINKIEENKEHKNPLNGGERGELVQIDKSRIGNHKTNLFRDIMIENIKTTVFDRRYKCYYFIMIPYIAIYPPYNNYIICNTLRYKVKKK